MPCRRALSILVLAFVSGCASVSPETSDGGAPRASSSNDGGDSMLEGLGRGLDGGVTPPARDADATASGSLDAAMPSDVPRDATPTPPDAASDGGLASDARTSPGSDACTGAGCDAAAGCEPDCPPRSQQLGSSAADYSLGAATDGQGNVYITGSTEAAFDGNAHAGGSDGFLIKLDPHGRKLWSRQFGTSGADSAWGVAIDDSDHVYVAGSTSGALEGDNAGGADVFVAKYDPEGQRVWVRQRGSAGYDIAEALAVDDAGDVYVVGRTDGALEGDNAGIEDLFVLKYAPDGGALWTRQLGSGGRDRAYAVACSGGGVFIAGFTTGLLGEQHVGGQDIFVARYDGAGQVQWVRQVGSVMDDNARSIALGAQGELYVAGHTEGGLDGSNQGPDDILLLSYNADGERQWMRQFGTAAFEDTRGAATDAQGNVYITGASYGSLSGQDNAGDFDMLVVKYDQSGELGWARLFGTARSDEARAVTIGADGTIFVAGTTQGDVDDQANSGGNDAVVVRFDTAGTRL